MIPASALNQRYHYPNFPEFGEFGVDLSLVDADLLHVIQHLRTASGIPMTPSPTEGAWGRTSGSPGSRHYAVGRLSDAGDIFPKKGRVLDLWLAAQAFRHRLIGGIGLYADTRGPDGTPWPMIHLDLRPARLLWTSEVTHDRRVYYYQAAPEDFWRVVARVIDEVAQC